MCLESDGTSMGRSKMTSAVPQVASSWNVGCAVVRDFVSVSLAAKTHRRRCNLQKREYDYVRSSSSSSSFTNS